MNSRTSLFQVKGSNVEQNLLFDFCNLLILAFLCNFCYFRFRAFIFLFLGTFNTFYVKFGSCYGQILIRSYFKIYYIIVLLMLIKIQTFIYCFSSGFQNPFLLQIWGPLWIQGILVDSRLFSEANTFCLLFSRGGRVLLLDSFASCIRFQVVMFGGFTNWWSQLGVLRGVLYWKTLAMI